MVSEMSHDLDGNNDGSTEVWKEMGCNQRLARVLLHSVQGTEKHLQSAGPTH